jgi:hypothetical protein
MEVDVARPNQQQKKTGILASLDHSAPSRRIPAWPLRTTFAFLGAVVLLAAAFWISQRATRPAVPPPANPGAVARDAMPDAPQAAMAAAIINEPAPTAPAKAGELPAQQSSTPVVRIPHKVQRAAPPRSTAPEDSDIALLAALVAHGISDKDIVERYSGANTASLVQRCRRLGGTEGELCKARICSGAARGETPCSAR